ncbi:hypothetical protein [Stenotrophomonas sp.]|uniref:hypothetical protein n=1 Tax=Stenotrophomonas sp. TaxID=69392 RepID=UPI0028A844FB|nr:hypothetical protein [Stenotrophomonas sp.]
MRPGAARNIWAFLAISGSSAAVAWAAYRFADAARLVAVLKDMWVLQGVLVTAVVSLIYRLQSDVASLAGLGAAQRSELDSMVRTKSLRLWVLFVLIAISALLPRVTDGFPSFVAQIAAFSLALSFFTAAYSAYLPSMWNELRTFVTALVAERERQDRRKAELERLRKAAEK